MKLLHNTIVHLMSEYGDEQAMVEGLLREVESLIAVGQYELERNGKRIDTLIQILEDEGHKTRPTIIREFEEQVQLLGRIDQHGLDGFMTTGDPDQFFPTLVMAASCRDFTQGPLDHLGDLYLVRDELIAYIAARLGFSESELRQEIEDSRQRIEQFMSEIPY